MSMRVLRKRPTPKTEVAQEAAAEKARDTAGGKKSEKPKPKASTPTNKPQESDLGTEGETEDDLPQIPVFGLSEFAISATASEDSNEGGLEMDGSSTSSFVGQYQRPRRVRKPPRDPVICPTCGKHFTRKAHLVRHMYLHTGERPFKCSRCDQSFNRKDHLGAHVRDHHADVKQYKCNTCQTSFEKVELLRIHMLKAHGKYQKSLAPLLKAEAEKEKSQGQGGGQSGSGPTLGFKILTCNLCNKRFTQTHLYKNHLATHHNQEDDSNERSLAEIQQAPELEPEGNDNDDLEYNDEENEETQQEGEDEDGMEVDDEDENEDEGQDEEEDGEGDDQDDIDADDLLQGLQNQVNPRRFECVVCAKVYKEQRTLRRHYKIHKRNFVCRFCGVKMSSAGSLMRHNLLHTGEKPFHCELCQRRFSRKDALKAHLVAHKKETSKLQLPRPYECKYCSASYTMRYNLIRHMKQCHVQGMNATRFIGGGAFRNVQHPHSRPPQLNPQRNLNLVQNQNQVEFSNSEENSLQCKHCGKVFANPKSLSTHMWYHNQKKRFICKVCNHAFKYQTDLNRHYMTHRAAARKGASWTQNMAQNKLQQARLQNQNQNVRTMSMSQSQYQQRSPPNHNSVIMNGVRKYPCGVCGQVFNHRSNRSRHMRLFHKGVQIQVQLEGHQVEQQAPAPGTSKNISGFQRQGQPVGKFLNRRFLPAGVQRSQPKPIQLKIEHQVPSRSNSIDQNIEDEAPNYNGMFKCIHCGKVFTKRYNYRLHMRTHNKQFVCGVCGLRTASQGDLTLHIRTHTGEKPFQCTECEWRFCRRSALTVHYRRHHGPNAKIKRHYNPQRVTPNMLPLDMESSSSSVKVEMETSPEKLSPGSILKTMLQNQSPGKSEAGEQTQTQPQKKKNLPPPPPLIRCVASPVKTSQKDQGQGGAEVMFLCRPCGIRMSGKENYVRHMLQVHGSNVVVTSSSGAGGQGQSLLKPGLKSIRAEQQREQAVACQNCGELFGSRHDLTVHLLTVHTGTEGPFNCGVCKKICSTMDFLVKHYQCVHPSLRNAAEEAMQLLASEEIQQEDYYAEEDENEVDPSEQLLFPEVVIKEEQGATGAGEEEENEENFEEEEDDDGSAMPNQAEEPEVEFYEPEGDEDGEGEISGSSSLTCPICNKDFKDKKALADHKWYHTRQAIHPCTFCGKKFKLKNDLIRHHKRHLQERPHACPEEGCTSRFYQKLDLDRHLAKVHHQLETMPHACQHCPSRFTQPGALLRHMKGSHPEEDVSNILMWQQVAQRRKAEEEEVQEFLNSLPEEEEEEDPGNNQELKQEIDQAREGQNQADDYSFEFEQLEMDSYVEEDDEQQQGEASSEYQVEGNENDDVDEGPPYLCKTCGKVYDSRQKYVYHRYYHVREFRYSCPVCQEKFKIKGHLERHIRTYHNSEKPLKQVLHCPVADCLRKFTRDYDLSNHIQNVHGKVPEVPAEIETGESQTQGQRVINVEDLYRLGMGGHPIWGDAEVGDNDDGDNEGQGSSSTSLLQPCMTKLEEYTNEDGELFCKACNKHFQDLKTLQNHVYYHQREMKHRCEDCGARFKQKSDLRRHISIHHDPNKQTQCIPCPNCNRSFTDERYLRIHLNRSCSGGAGGGGEGQELEMDINETREHLNPSMEIEDIEENDNEVYEDYNEEFEEGQEGQQEQEDEEWGEVPDPLMYLDTGEENEEEEEVEGLQYGMEDDMEDVGEVDEEPMFNCNICGATFSRSNELILHKRSHVMNSGVVAGGSSNGSSKKNNNNANKTFACDKCGQSFMQKGELTQHLQLYHLDELDVFQCQFCPKFFYVKKSLDTHRRRHHSHLMNLHPCQLCGMKFSQKESLASHVKSIHGNLAY